MPVARRSRQALPYVQLDHSSSTLAVGSFAFAASSAGHGPTPTPVTCASRRFAAALVAALAYLPTRPAGADRAGHPASAAASSTRCGAVALARVRRPRVARTRSLSAGRGRRIAVGGCRPWPRLGTALAAAAFGWAPTAVDAVPFLLQLVCLTAVTGGSMAAVVLGHWYLVTPKLSNGR